MKKSDDIKIKSFIHIYWSLLILIVLLSIYYRSYIKEGFGINFMFTYLLCIWIPVMIINLFEILRLLNYINNSYPDALENLLFRSTKNLTRFIDEHGANDTVLKQLGDNHKKVHIFSVVVFAYIGFSLLFYL